MRFADMVGQHAEVGTSHSVQAPSPALLGSGGDEPAGPRCEHGSVSGGLSALGEGGRHGRSLSRVPSGGLLSLLFGSQNSGEMRPILDLCILNRSIALGKLWMLTIRALLRYVRENDWFTSIHPFSSAYPGPGRSGSWLSRAPQASFSPATLSSSSWGILRHSQAR